MVKARLNLCVTIHEITIVSIVPVIRQETPLPNFSNVYLLLLF